MVVALISSFEQSAYVDTAQLPSGPTSATDQAGVKPLEMALRWFLAVSIGAAVVLSLHLGLVQVVKMIDGASTGPAPIARADPWRVSDGLVLRTVQDGETLWSIAVELQPSGDPRPLVDRLVHLNGGSQLLAGVSIVVPASGSDLG